VSASGIGRAVGAVIAGRYVIEQELGQGGGMATVYHAWDGSQTRPVAIKFLEAPRADPVAVTRFAREIVTLANLQHPHILPLYDSGQDSDGSLFFVMPFIAGGSLRSWMDRDQRLAPDDVLRLAQQLASALAFAHARSVIHRDIKPQNVLIQDGGGRALLADFGIAHGAGGSRLTTTGVILGTPGYMSPEQAYGDPVDGRSDIYSLGCVLYEALAGAPPNRDPGGGTTRYFGPAAPIRPLRKDVPEPLEAAVLRATLPMPNDRFQSADELSHALDAIATKRRRR
jgi:eukaryotic-like serine/threonine-protein kinase